MNALLVGATGATGRDLLQLLVADPEINRVEIFVRKAPELAHQKVHVHVIDFNQPNQWRQLVKGDVLFSCLGTTLKEAGSKKAQWKIDYDYQYEFAKAASDNNVKSYVLVSSGYASPDAFFHYPKMKGMLEEAVKKLAFRTVSIFRPPILIRKNTNRLMEKAGRKLVQTFNKIGLFQSQKPMPTEILAQAMINAAKINREGNFTFEAKDIWPVAESNYAG